MMPLRLRFRPEPMPLHLDAASSTDSGRGRSHEEGLAALNRRHREYYQGEKPVKRGTDDELPSTYTVAEARELNRLRREGSTVSLAERVQHRREDVKRAMGRLDEFPAEITPVAIFAKGVWGV